ncbi:heme transporter HRG1 [Nematostella vectensis]|uniref:heme transporter HRG1 n=1 Tax=Nematostella vectensis TaxID=45351 RepID=UPI0020770A9A|nr:heme transporter HRG1 [Nematostella vectensis]
MDAGRDSKRARYKYIAHVVAGSIGVILGISACCLFYSKYNNYKVGSLALVSSLFALVFLHLAISLRNDHRREFTRRKFSIYMVIGVVGTIAGVVSMVVYGVLGAKHHEKGVDLHGYYLGTVWGFMTFKWGLATFFSAWRSYKSYLSADDCTMIVNT